MATKAKKMEYFTLIKKSAVFADFDADEVHQALTCLAGYTQFFPKKSVITATGETLAAIGIVLRGGVSLNQLTMHGHKQILAWRGVGELIGENALKGQAEAAALEMIATEDSLLLFIRMDKILNPKKATCHLRQRMIENLFRLLLHNNQMLYQKIDLQAQKSLRERICYYLKLQQKKNNQPLFTIPFSRSELAEYLGAERSALSRELSKMQKDGLIQYNGKHFELLF